MSARASLAPPTTSARFSVCAAHFSSCSTPTPLAQDTLLLPLVGYLDEQRSGELTCTLLDAIQTRCARAVVLDLAGLAALDADTAERLRQTTEAARLLGCRVTLVGVRANQALALAALNLGAAGVRVARDIPAVLADSPGRVSRTALCGWE